MDGEKGRSAERKSSKTRPEPGCQARLVRELALERVV